MPKKIEITKVLVDTRKIIDRRDWVKYLVLVNWHIKELDGVLQRASDPKFEEYVSEQLQSYIEGKEPPAAIKGAIMNLADEQLGSGSVTLRAGDYVALQTQYRAVSR